MNGPIALHSGMPIACELLVRQVVLEGLHEIANDEDRLRELVGRVDALLDGSQDEWADELVRAFRRILTPAEPDHVKVLVGQPLSAGDLPCVTILKEAGSEDTGGAVVGDILDLKYIQRGTYEYTPQAVDGAGDPTIAPQTAPQIDEHRLVGTAWTTTVQVGSWTTAPELSLLLDAAVHDALMRGKGRLIAAGVHDVTFSEGGQPTDRQTQVELRCGYVPMQRATLDWIRGTTRRKGPVPNRVTILPGTFRV